MAIYLVNHKHGCGCEEIEADSPEQAIEIRRSQLTEREAGYQMFATLADTDEKPHTPGPWHAGCGNGEGSVFMDAEGRMRLERGGTTLTPICTVHDFDGERYANARLIAAAPELLESLIELRELLVYSHSDDSRLQRLSRASSAIAKATGNE